MWPRRFNILALLLTTRLLAAENKVVSTNLIPPAPLREFRAAWITEVAANPDWPTKPGLTTAAQKTELIGLLERAAQLHFNAVFMQVRPACDAFYASPLEPWSDRLTGVQGRAPAPFYDPLAFAIAEAHKRGLQLHAWFNPYRAAHPGTKPPLAANQITRTHPELIRRYDGNIWLDPGEPEAQRRTLAVVLDVVKRYDVDGIVFDDYFYPYPGKDRDGRELDFPDQASWQKYGMKTGLARDDWRRDNVNQLVQKVSSGIKAVKPQVQFGISPFGIWRPQNPPSIKGLDAYAAIYADARKWLTNGWVDYFAPQLYWAIAAREQSFPVLLNWWCAQNVQGRHLLAALNDTAVGGKFTVDEITRQVQTVRSRADTAGVVHYHLRTVLEKPELTAAVKAQYAQPALVPPSPWLDAVPPDQPKITVKTTTKSVTIRWANGGPEPACAWLLQTCSSNVWTTEVFPASQGGRILYRTNYTALAVRAVDRLGNLSPPALWPVKPVASTNASPSRVKLQ